MARKQPQTAPESPKTDLEEAILVRTQAFEDLGVCGHDDRPKFVDAYARAANVVRQIDKDRKRALHSFTDDEIAAHIRGLPERRREALMTAVSGASMAGKPLF